MKNVALLSLVMLALVGSSGCRGPKGSPDGTVKSWFSAIEAEDWEAMADMASAKSMSKAGSREKAMNYFAKAYGPWTKANVVSIDESLIDADGKGATVMFTCVSTMLENHKENDYDCSDTFALVKEEDEKWHLHIPGAGGLKRM
ncbi:MAG: hypothetical protein U0228_21315 [Myxococcaceae bacterium]